MEIREKDAMKFYNSEIDTNKITFKKLRIFLTIIVMAGYWFSGRLNCQASPFEHQDLKVNNILISLSLHEIKHESVALGERFYPSYSNTNDIPPLWAIVYGGEEEGNDYVQDVQPTSDGGFIVAVNRAGHSKRLPLWSLCLLSFRQMARLSGKMLILVLAGHEFFLFSR